LPNHHAVTVAHAARRVMFTTEQARLVWIAQPGGRHRGRRPAVSFGTSLRSATKYAGSG
jgi:hypothetical protein